MRHLKAPTVLTTAVLTATAPVFLLLLWVDLPLLQDLTVEDGPVEYLTAGTYLAATVLFVVAAARRLVPRRWALPLAALSLFVAGEEVSWGQRLLGLSTPAALEAGNVQGEMNLHNLEGVHGNVRAVGLLVILVLFVGLPLLARTWDTAGRLVSRTALPLPSLVALPLVLVGVAYMAGPRLLAGSELFVLDEVGELYVSAAWLVYAVSAVTGTRRVRQPSAGQPSAGQPHRVPARQR